MAELQVPEEYTLDDLLMEDEDDKQKITVAVGKKTKTYWIRPPTEPEKSMAQNAARQKSRQLRDRLTDPETEEHQLLIQAEIENMNEEEIRKVWLTSNLFQKTFELSRRSLDSREDYFVDRPEGREDGVIPPTSGELDKYEQDKVEQEQKRLKDLQNQQTVIFKELNAKSAELPVGDLVEIIKPIIVEVKASQEWNSQYGLQILIRCTFSDAQRTKRAFEATGDALRLNNSPSGQKILKDLLDAHSGLMLDPDRLKN